MFRTYHVYGRHEDSLVFHTVHTDAVEAQRQFAAAKLCGLSVLCFGRRRGRAGSVMLCSYHPEADGSHVRISLRAARRHMRFRLEGGSK